MANWQDTDEDEDEEEENNEKKKKRHKGRTRSQTKCTLWVRARIMVRLGLWLGQWLVIIWGKFNVYCYYWLGPAQIGLAIIIYGYLAILCNK